MLWNGMEWNFMACEKYLNKFLKNLINCKDIHKTKILPVSS